MKMALKSVFVNYCHIVSVWCCLLTFSIDLVQPKRVFCIMGRGGIGFTLGMLRK